MSTAIIGRNLFDARWPSSEIWLMMRSDVGALGRHVRPREGMGHEIVVKFCRALSRRCRVDCLAVRPGNVANRNTRRPASHHHGRSAETGGKATSAEAGGKRSGISPGVVNRSSAIVNRSNASGCARFNIGQDCQAGEIRQQLQRWLRNKLQIRQRPLGRVQLVGGIFFNLLVNVQRHTHLQKLPGLHGDQSVPGLGDKESLVVL
jgi:hypothetical protein